MFQLSLTKRNSNVPYSKRRCIYVTARQHAAETHGSLIMHNLITELTMNAEKYDYLLSNTVIKLVPMINPDGVTIGNTRTSLVGVDLNRRWGNPN